ncbi:MAG TPA: hypothetical protein DDW55_13785 [Gammaproteobacteria bacterium]|nr:hypothetical protein [Gammaproteobacteria bacterium]
MPSRNNSTCLQQYRYLLTVFVLLLAGCASPGATLQVKPRHDAGIQYSPQEITGMMEILGYEQLRVLDPDIQRPVLVATNDGEYRLLFQYKDNTGIRVGVRIVMGNGNIGLHLYQPGRDDLDDAAMVQYERLRQRLILQYGAEHVSDRHPALAP